MNLQIVQQSDHAQMEAEIFQIFEWKGIKKINQKKMKEVLAKLKEIYAILQERSDVWRSLFQKDSFQMEFFIWIFKKYISWQSKIDHSVVLNQLNEFWNESGELRKIIRWNSILNDFLIFIMTHDSWGE